MVLGTAATAAGLKRPVPLALAEKDDHKSFSVAKGSAIIVRLTYHAGTAYSWQLTKVPTCLKAIKSSASGQTTVKMPGGSVIRTFSFVAANAGKGVLSLALTSGGHRPPAKSFSVTLDVKGKG